eukprot:5783086-Pleurochrysis_carterae.AAC.1
MRFNLLVGSFLLWGLAATHHDVADSDGSDSNMSGAHEAMFEMPSAFHKPLSAEEMEMLAASPGDECGECELPTDMPCTSASAASVSQHAHD